MAVIVFLRVAPAQPEPERHGNAMRRDRPGIGAAGNPGRPPAILREILREKSDLRDTRDYSTEEGSLEPVDEESSNLAERTDRAANLNSPTPAALRPDLRAGCDCQWPKSAATFDDPPTSSRLLLCQNGPAKVSLNSEKTRFELFSLRVCTPLEGVIHGSDSFPFGSHGKSAEAALQVEISR